VAYGLSPVWFVASELVNVPPGNTSATNPLVLNPPLPVINSNAILSFNASSPYNVSTLNSWVWVNKLLKLK